MDDKDKDSLEEEKAGYLVLRIKTGCGLVINDIIEVRISAIKTLGEVEVAVRAPKKMPIRRVR